MFFFLSHSLLLIIINTRICGLLLFQALVFGAHGSFYNFFYNNQHAAITTTSKAREIKRASTEKKRKKNYVIICCTCSYFVICRVRENECDETYLFGYHLKFTFSTRAPHTLTLARSLTTDDEGFSKPPLLL